MRLLTIGLSILGLIALAGPAECSLLSFQGTLADDSQLVLIDFMVNGAQSVTIQSYGYAGGVTPDSITVQSGGFAPYAVLFDGGGNEISADNGGHCATTGADANTGNCDDPLIINSLGTGSYTLVVSVWDNVPVDGSLPDGYTQTGNPGFTCGEFSQSGNFCDVTTGTGVQRNGGYFVEISGTDVFTPEPGTILFGIAGAVGVVFARRKQIFGR
jgi:hypothetical protein